MRIGAAALNSSCAGASYTSANFSLLQHSFIHLGALTTNRIGSHSHMLFSIAQLFIIKSSHLFNTVRHKIPQQMLVSLNFNSQSTKIAGF